MFTVARFGSRATSICPSASAKFLVSSSVDRRAVERHRDVQALAARRLHDRDEPERVEELAQLDRDAAAVEHVGRRARDRGRARSRTAGSRRGASTGSCAARARRGSRATRAWGGLRRCSCAGRRWARAAPTRCTHVGVVGRAPLLEEPFTRAHRRARARAWAGGRRGGGASPARSAGSSRSRRLCGSPAAGYSCLSRFESESSRPSTSTVTRFGLTLSLGHK